MLVFDKLPFITAMVHTLINSVVDGLSRQVKMLLFSTFPQTGFEDSIFVGEIVVFFEAVGFH